MPYAFKKTQVADSLVQRCKLSPYTSRRVERYHPCFESRRYFASNVVQEKKSRRLMYMTALVFGLVGCSYAVVPLYQKACQATGYGGTVQHHEIVEEKNGRHSRDGIVTTREIVVQFNTDVADGTPWKFIPMQSEVRVKPGESALAFYTAENQSSTLVVGVPTYNVTPVEATGYFKCICLEEQRLLPGQEVEMPVFFCIDPELENDSKMDGINKLTLSYAFAEVPKEEK